MLLVAGIPRHPAVNFLERHMEAIKMKHVLIKFEQADQIINFVRIINRYDYEADIKCGSRIVDAKSILGVLSLAKAKTCLLYTSWTSRRTEAPTRPASARSAPWWIPTQVFLR